MSEILSRALLTVGASGQQMCPAAQGFIEIQTQVLMLTLYPPTHLPSPELFLRDRAFFVAQISLEHLGSIQPKLSKFVGDSRYTLPHDIF